MTLASVPMHPRADPLSSQLVYRLGLDDRPSSLLVNPEELYHLLLTRPKLSSSSHYRLVSTRNQQTAPPTSFLPVPGQARRLRKQNTVSRSPSMHFFKDGKEKEKEKDGAIAKKDASTVKQDASTSKKDASASLSMATIKRHSKPAETSTPQRPILAPTFSAKSTKRLQEMLAPLSTDSSSEDITHARKEFYPRTWWARKHGMHRLHPYQEDAPNVFAYDSVLLERYVVFSLFLLFSQVHSYRDCSDKQTHALLQKLTPKNSPTFHDYGKKPPSRVLDLGCGDMTWVEAAADAWAGQTHGVEIVGFDLVDVPRMVWKDGRKPRAHTSFVQGNLYVFPLSLSRFPN